MGIIRKIIEKLNLSAGKVAPIVVQPENPNRITKVKRLNNGNWIVTQADGKNTYIEK